MRALLSDPRVVLIILAIIGVAMVVVAAGPPGPGVAGIFSAGVACSILLFVFHDTVRTLELDWIGPDEAVLMTTKAPILSCRGGWIGWGHFCGKLFLTNERLVFVSLWGNTGSISQPIRDIEWADVSLDSLRVRLAGGEDLLFTVEQGASFYTGYDAETWAARILRESRRPEEAPKNGPGSPSDTDLTLHRT
jgi:hypothetical protein